MLASKGQSERSELTSKTPDCRCSTYGDYSFTAWGLILTLLGTFLAAMKTVITYVIQTGGGGRLKLVSRKSGASPEPFPN